MRKILAVLSLIIVLLFTVGISPVLATDTSAPVPVPPPSDWLGKVGGGIALDPNSFSIQDDLIPQVITFAFVGVAIASVIFLLIGGIKWIMSGGEKANLAKAKSTITYSLLGLGLALMSYFIFSALQMFLGAKIF